MVTTWHSRASLAVVYEWARFVVMVTVVPTIWSTVNNSSLSVSTNLNTSPAETPTALVTTTTGWPLAALDASRGATNEPITCSVSSYPSTFASSGLYAWSRSASNLPSISSIVLVPYVKPYLSTDATPPSVSRQPTVSI